MVRGPPWRTTITTTKNDLLRQGNIHGCHFLHLFWKTRCEKPVKTLDPSSNLLFGKKSFPIKEDFPDGGVWFQGSNLEWLMTNSITLYQREVITIPVPTFGRLRLHYSGIVFYETGTIKAYQQSLIIGFSGLRTTQTRRWQHGSYSDSIGSQNLMKLKIGLTKKNSPLMEWTYIKNIDIQTNHGMWKHHNTSPVN